LQPFLLAVATAAQATLKHAPITAAAKTPPVAAPTAPTVPTLMTMTWMQMHASWLTHTVATIGILAAMGLVILLAIQTTKQEGLSGTIGGRVESAYRGRPGMEEQLKKVTGFTAGTFVVAFLILSLTGI
jgi:protein translocase SecG subunit